MYIQGGPKWESQVIVLPEALKEEQVVFYRDIVECLRYLEENPAFEGFQHHQPVKWFSDAELKERIYG
jgi:hypothetical protein